MYALPPFRITSESFELVALSLLDIRWFWQQSFATLFHRRTCVLVVNAGMSRVPLRRLQPPQRPRGVVTRRRNVVMAPVME